eukprot:m51a1_g8925 hypothetical protein (1338) ;mRNA; r:828280-834535
MWREEAAANGSSDKDHVSLRSFNFPDYWLCAVDGSGADLHLGNSASDLSLCTFRKTPGLSDAGLVSFVNEGRYLALATTATGNWATWMSMSQVRSFDVQLIGFPATKESATWAPSDSTFVTIRPGLYNDPRALLLHNCQNNIRASVPTVVSYDWALDKDPLSISIRSVSNPDLYICMIGHEGRLAKPAGNEQLCSFVSMRDPFYNPNGRNLGGFALYNTKTDTFLQAPNSTDKLDACVPAAVGLQLFGVNDSFDGETAWTFYRTFEMPVLANITAKGTAARAISPYLHGITLDEANFGLDGGLYAQLLRNRDFEAQGRGNLGDGQQIRTTPLATDMRPWTVATTQGTATVGLTTATHPFDTNPVALSVAATAAATVQLTNPGYWGIAVVKGTTYKGSVRAKSSCAWSASAVLRDNTGDVSTTWTKSIAAGDWAKMEFTLAGQKTSTSANFVFGVGVTSACTVWLDSFSLIPADAVLGSRGAKTLEGTSADTRWSFGGTVGEADARPGHYSSAWGSWSTDGLGLHEFLLLAESLAAHPILSLFAGRVVHMIEYANGAATTTYGAMRKSNGHALPFNVREVQIGSGYDSSMADYARFFNPTLKAVATAFPDINITASSSFTAMNPCLSNRTFCTTWSARFQQFQTVMISDAHKYDSTDRSLPLLSVVNSHQPTDLASMDSASAEGAWLVGMERNADTVSHYSLAPALRNNNAAQMNVGLVAFDSAQTYLLPSHHVHRMVGEFPCTHTLETAVPSGRNAIACRTAEGHVVFKVANWGSNPLFATLSVSSKASSVTISMVSGPGPTSYDAPDVGTVTRTLAGTQALTAVLPWYSFAVVVFRDVLPMDNVTAPSSSSASSADPCAAFTACTECLPGAGAQCGWCEKLQRCIAATASSQCPSDWRFDTSNTAAIVGGAVGGGGFAIVVIAVAVVVVVITRRGRGDQKSAVPNIPIDNASVNFVAASTASTTLDLSGLGTSAVSTAVLPGLTLSLNPAAGNSSGSSATPPKPDLDMLTSINGSLHFSTDLMAASMPQMTLAQTYLLPSYNVHRLVAEFPCTHTLETSVPSGRNGIACRTAEGHVVFKVANNNSNPLITALSVSSRATSIIISVVSGPSPTSYDPSDVGTVTRTVAGSQKVTVVVPWYAFAVVVFRDVLPALGNATASSSIASPMVAANKDSNTAAIIGGAVGGGGFVIIVIAIVVVVVARSGRKQKNTAVPNIPIDNASVNFVAASTASTTLDLSGLGTIGVPPTLPGFSPSLPPKADPGLLSLMGSLHLSADLAAASLPRMTLSAGFPLTIVPPPSVEEGRRSASPGSFAVSGGSSSLESAGRSPRQGSQPAP